MSESLQELQERIRNLEQDGVLGVIAMLGEAYSNVKKPVSSEGDDDVSTD